MLNANDRFEIRVALVGYVSVGKSTVLNALLGDKFSEVSMRRTTAGVNYFKIISQSKVKTEDGPDSENREDVEVQSATEIHQKIASDNQKLRGKEDLQERFFDIEIEEPLCEMREDTDLILVDIPGLNEAGTSIYWDYVEEKWTTFDCVIVVMDALQGVNTEEQIRLLKTVEQNKTKHKDVPVIILGNKVDNPDDAEQAQLVGESRKKTIEIFGNGCSKESLKEITNGKGIIEFKSAFVPCSAANAFIYRTVAHLSPEKFKLLDKSFVDRLGQEEVGRRKWKTMSDEKKAEVVFGIVKDPVARKEGLEDTNFFAFLKSFERFVGGKETQLDLIKQQLEVARRILSFENASKSIEKIYTLTTLLKLAPGSIEEDFWKVYGPKEKEIFQKMETSIDPTPLATLMKSLAEYRKLASNIGWKNEKEKAAIQMKEVVLFQLNIPLGKVAQILSSSSNRTMCKACASKTNGAKTLLDPQYSLQNSLLILDWKVLIYSMLLPSYDRVFHDQFGPEKLHLEHFLAVITSNLSTLDEHYHSGSSRSSRSRSSRSRSSRSRSSRSKSKPMIDCRSCGSSYKPSQHCAMEQSLLGKFDQKRVFQPTYPSAFHANCRLEMPRDLSDPKHWGHVVHLYCREMAE